MLSFLVVFLSLLSFVSCIRVRIRIGDEAPEGFPLITTSSGNKIGGFGSTPSNSQSSGLTSEGENTLLFQLGSSLDGTTTNPTFTESSSGFFLEFDFEPSDQESENTSAIIRDIGGTNITLQYDNGTKIANVSVTVPENPQVEIVNKDDDDGLTDAQIAIIVVFAFLVLCIVVAFAVLLIKKRQEKLSKIKPSSSGRRRSTGSDSSDSPTTEKQDDSEC
eukprot:m.68898 g.68898  ORF g.68898 m.68898 type:complete len:219 (+) comp19936_c0_seq3:64-720(+)